MLHRLMHGHWPTWERVDYDFLTWRTICAKCHVHDDSGCGDFR